MARQEDEPGDPELEDESEDGFDDEEFTSALTARPKQPFLDWVRDVGPEAAQGEGAGDPNVVLTPELAGPSDRDTWLAQHHEDVFAALLSPWTDDEGRWPDDLSVDALRRWFDLEWAPLVHDLSRLDVLPPVTCAAVSLPAIRAEFDVLPDGSAFFLDVQTGEMVSFSPAELEAIEHGDPSIAGIDEASLAEARHLYESESLLELPAPSERLTLLLMHSFAEPLRIPGVRNRLLNALEARKPVRRFLEAVDASGLRRQWQAHRDQGVLDLLRKALARAGVPLVGEDPPGEPRPSRSRG